MVRVRVRGQGSGVRVRVRVRADLVVQLVEQRLDPRGEDRQARERGGGAHAHELGAVLQALDARGLQLRHEGLEQRLARLRANARAGITARIRPRVRVRITVRVRVRARARVRVRACAAPGPCQ